MVEGVATRGWAIFPPEPEVDRWAAAARAAALARMAEPARMEAGLACEGTWFVGLDCLPNDAAGQVGGVALTGTARQAAEAIAGPLPLHPGQVSVVYPGYPRPRAGEGEGAFRYRLRRDAAHVDGLLPVGEARRRMLRERHAYILGLPLTEADDRAAPLVVWEGSHRILRRAFAEALGGVAPEGLGRCRSDRCLSRGPQGGVRALRPRAARGAAGGRDPRPSSRPARRRAVAGGRAGPAGGPHGGLFPPGISRSRAP